MKKIAFVFSLITIALVGVIPAAAQNAGDFDAVRIEDDFNLAYPAGKTEEIVSYLKGRYIDDQTFVKNLGPNITSTFGDEDFIDTYFDTGSLDLYKRKIGLRHRIRFDRLDPNASKNGRELIQLKLSADDKFADSENLASRNELKYDVVRSSTIVIAEDRHPVLGLIPENLRPEFKARLVELSIEIGDLRPILTIAQRRQRVYLNRDGATFVSFSMDDAKSHIWWARSDFSQMEVELNELAYTNADPQTRQQLQDIRQTLITDLRARFDYLENDATIKYTKMFDLLENKLPFLRTLVKNNLHNDQGAWIVFLLPLLIIIAAVYAAYSFFTRGSR